MITTTEDSVEWTRWCEEAGIEDPYWSWEHLSLWAPEWNARPLGVGWRGEGGRILHPVLLVPLDRLEGGDGRVDVRSAYDFAGPRHAGENPDAAMASFEREWTGLALELGVVTEFLRLHPTALPVLPSWATLHDHNHVVDLTVGYEAIRSGYHRSFRRGLKRAEGLELVVEVAKDPEAGDTEHFIETYHRAMVAVDAPFWFHFQAETLRRFLTLPDASLVTVRDGSGTPLAMATVLASGPTLFYHLGCSDPDGLGRRPNHRLFDGLIRLGIGGGFDTLHLGGGSPSLQRFKSQFANSTVHYSVVRRVLDPHAYGELCRVNGGDEEGPAFPAYIERFGPGSGGSSENG